VSVFTFNYAYSPYLYALKPILTFKESSSILFSSPLQADAEEVLVFYPQSLRVLRGF